MTKQQTPPPPSSTSDRRQWERIFKTLVDMLQTQNSQIQTLADDRKLLESYIRIQHDHWSSRARFLESHIAQLKKEEARCRKIQEARVHLMTESMQTEALCYKKQCELAESELEDFRACIEALNIELHEVKDKLNNNEAGNGKKLVDDLGRAESSKDGERCAAALEREIRMLKHSYKRLSSKKETEISAMLLEKDFVWNQLKTMESRYIASIKTKNVEVEQANEAIRKLRDKLQDLQMSINEKDEMICQLKNRHDLHMRTCIQEAEQANEKIDQLQLDVVELQSLAKQKDETIAKLISELSKFEMDVQDRIMGKSRYYKEQSKNASMAPSESKTRKGSKKNKSASEKQGTNQNHRNSSESRASAPVHGLVRCSSKRRTRADSSIERQVFFHSNFKVPKLRNSPPVVV